MKILMAAALGAVLAIGSAARPGEALDNDATVRSCCTCTTCECEVCECCCSVPGPCSC